jgi:hypothetical protein
MTRRELIALLGGLPAARPFAAFAQMSVRRPLVALLSVAPSTNVSRDVLSGFREGMQELGYVAIDHRIPPEPPTALCSQATSSMSFVS